MGCAPRNVGTGISARIRRHHTPGSAPACVGARLPGRAHPGHGNGDGRARLPQATSARSRTASVASRVRGIVEGLKQLQAQLLHSEKLASLGQLAGGAAHELNNPLTAMLGYSELLV